MTSEELPRRWIEAQLPGLEDEVLWTDYALVVSVPNPASRGLSTGITYRVLVHRNYLDWERRSCVRDQNGHIRFDALPALLDDVYGEYQQEVWRQLNPFI